MVRRGQTPGISLWEPWASFVMRGWKTIETRTHDRFRSLEGRTIGVHATKKWDPDYLLKANAFMNADQFEAVKDIRRKHCQAILGTARVQTVRVLSPSDSFAAMYECASRIRFGLVLRDVKVFARPVLCTGHQGIWYISTEKLGLA
jgi:predicted transcriptional regulator